MQVFYAVRDEKNKPWAIKWWSVC